VVDAGSFARFMVGWEVEGVEEELGGGFLEGEFAAGIIFSVVVIIPGGENGGCLGEGGVVRKGGEAAVFLGHDFFVIGVAVDIVPHEEEGLRLIGGDGFPNSFVAFRLIAGTAGEAGDGLFREKRGEE